MKEEQYVRIAEFGTGREGTVLKTVVGSCIALCLWDGKTLAGGMVHIMMPDSRENRTAESGIEKEGKYADLAVPGLVGRLTSGGSSLKDLSARIAGGASMFLKPGETNAAGSALSIGRRNRDTVVWLLKQTGIPLVKEDTGGTKGRKVELDCGTGGMTSRGMN